MQHKIKLLNKEESWHRLRNYKPNDTVNHNNKLWQNVTGLNSEPNDTSKDWFDIRATDKTDVVAPGNYKPVESDAVEKYAVKKINNIAELRNTQGEYEGQIVELLGYYEIGDKPSLKYKYVNGQGVDNGGSIISNSSGIWEAIFEESIDVRHFGVIPSTTISYFTQIEKASVFSDSVGLPLFFSKSNTPYLVTSQVNIFSDIISDGAIIQGGGRGSTAFIIRNSLKLQGLEFRMSKTGTSDSAPIAILYSSTNTQKIDKLHIKDNTFIDCRIAIINYNSFLLEDILIENNTFNVDFTGLPIFNVQNDVVSLRGVNNVKIIANTFKTKETNRVFKIQAGITDDYTTASENIIISNNYIEAIGRIDSGDGQVSKQVFDLFNYTRNVIFTNNIVKCRDYIIVFEDKTSNNQLSVTRTYTITDNYFENNNQMVHIEGTYSRDDLNLSNRDITIVKSSGNTYVSTTETTSVKYPLEDFQFIDDLVVENNYYGYPIASLSGGAPIGLNLLNSKNVKILGNTFQNCYPYILAYSNSPSFVYTRRFENVNISNNTFRFDEMSTASTLWITGSSTNQGLIDILTIVNNKFICPLGTTAFRSIRLTYMNVNQLFVFGNQTDSSNTTQVLRTGSIVTKEIHFANTWTTGDKIPIDISYFSSSYLTPTNSVGYSGQLNDLPRGNYSIAIGTTTATDIPTNIGVARSLISFGGATIGGQILIGTTGISYRQYSGAIAYGAWYSLNVPNASITIKGLVNQAEPSADIATPLSETYTQTEVQAILTELRDLKTKLRSAGILSV